MSTEHKREPKALPGLVAVTSSIRPYIFDLPHLMSLPYGFSVRLTPRLTPRVERKKSSGDSDPHR